MAESFVMSHTPSADAMTLSETNLSTAFTTAFTLLAIAWEEHMRLLRWSD
jgi:hypothetical protein